MAKQQKDDFEPDDFEPEMTFAIVNGVRIPLGGDEADNPELSRQRNTAGLESDDSKPETTQPETQKPIQIPEPSAILERLTKPLVDFTPEMRSAMMQFQQSHPILGGMGNFAANMLTGESSPLSLGLGALGAGETVASKLGMDQLAGLLKLPSRAAGGSMIWHGMGKVGDSDTLGGKVGGGLEALLGGLAMKGPRGGVELERPSLMEEQPKIQPELERNIPGSILDEQNLRSNPQTGMIFRGDSPNLSIPEFETSNPRQLAPTELPRTLSRETPITPDDMGFFEKFVKSTEGSVKLPNLPFGNKTTKRPLRALDELHDALIDASASREMTEELYKGERAKRFAAYDQPKSQGRKGFYEGLSRLKGKMPRDAFEPIEMNRDSARALYNEIERRIDLSTPDRIHASTGLGKILGDYKAGEAPQLNEIKAIRKVFGDSVADQLAELHSGVPITREALNEAANLSKAMMASMDASAPFRQGLGLIHTREFWQNYAKMYSYIGKGAYDIMEQAIHEDPMYKAVKSAGIRFTDISEKLGAGEEQFSSKIARMITGIPASERMYTGFLNKTRFDVTKRLLIEAEKAGLKPFIRNSAGELVPTKLGRDIASTVNNATGRGSLGRFEKNAVELNTAFFSPRLISSRLTMLNPAYYIKLEPFARKQALKSLFAIATAGKIVEELGKAAGGQVETSDPTSTDYHKVRVGNTRIDPYGGFQQYIVAANRLLAGAVNNGMGKTSKDGITLGQAFSRTLGIGGRFGSTAENKLSPIVKFADDILSSRPAEDTGSGNILNAAGIAHSANTARVANLFTPMIIQDLADLMKEDPSLIPLSLLSSQGMGVQTYPEQQKSNGFRQLAR